MDIPIIGKIETEIINPVLNLLFVLAFLYFVYGIYEFVQASDDTAARETGKKHILYSVIGLFIMIGVWGIVRLVCSTIGAGCS